MILDEPYNSWLIKNVGENIDESMRFMVKAHAATPAGPVTINVPFDLTWFILLYSKDTPQAKLEVARALLKKPGYLEQFKATLQIHDAKRLLAEFLLFNPEFLEGLKQYIDFSLLNVPLDMISHALLIKLTTSAVDPADLDKQRIKIVELILDSGFVLKGDVPPTSVGVALHKLLLMDVGAEKFTLAKRLTSAGFTLFSENSTNNNEVAAILIANRTNPDCQEIIKNNAPGFKQLSFKVAGSVGSNIADYYYWVKEDMSAVDFIRKTFNIDITP